MLHLMQQVFKKPEISILQLSCIVTLSSYVMTNQFEQQNFFLQKLHMSKGLEIFLLLADLSLQSSSFGVNEFIGRSHSDYFLVPQNFSVASFFVITKSGCSMTLVQGNQASSGLTTQQPKYLSISATLYSILNLLEHPVYLAC